MAAYGHKQPVQTTSGVAADDYAWGESTLSEQILLPRITSSSDICHGKPCICGLRHPVEFVLKLLSSGIAQAEMLADYEDMEADDLLSAMD